MPQKKDPPVGAANTVIGQPPCPVIPSLWWLTYNGIDVRPFLADHFDRDEASLITWRRSRSSKCSCAIT